MFASSEDLFCSFYFIQSKASSNQKPLKNKTHTWCIITSLSSLVFCWTFFFSTENKFHWSNSALFETKSKKRSSKPKEQIWNPSYTNEIQITFFYLFICCNFCTLQRNSLLSRKHLLKTRSLFSWLYCNFKL